MIQIAGRPFDETALMGEFAQDSVERQVWSKMAQSSETYRFDSVAQLRFELTLRREIVNAARALDRSAFAFAVFHYSKCNPKYWKRTGNGGFELLGDAKPSEAIRDIYTNGHLYATECATAMVIVYYKALLEVFGDELFDATFPKITLMNWHGLPPLLREVGIPRPAKDVLLGDRGYFDNPDVDPETPQWQGENVIVLPDDLYYGHGIGIRTAEEIIRALNSNRFEGATQSAEFLDSLARPNFKRLFEVSSRGASTPAVLDWTDFPSAV
ncbi:MAG: protein-glutamine gamma-glutamyltransferase [Bacillota bacterium]